MASTFSDNISFYGNKPNFERDKVATTEELLAVDPAKLEYPYGHIVFCEATGKHYKYIYDTKNPPAADKKNDVTGWFEVIDKVAEEATARLDVLDGDENTEGSVKNTAYKEFAKYSEIDENTLPILQDIAAWIEDDTTGSADIIQQVGELYGIIDSETQRAMTAEGVLQAQIAAINLGAKVVITISHPTIYKGIPRTINVEANIGEITPEKIEIYTGDTLLATNNSGYVVFEETVKLSEDTKSYAAKAYYSGAVLQATKSLQARHPIYAGFGSSASAVAVAVNMLSARTSAAGTYKATAVADKVKYYILVPSDIEALTSFTMGGSHFVMNSGTFQQRDITYKVYESGSTYNTGATVDIKAS